MKKILILTACIIILTCSGLLADSKTFPLDECTWITSKTTDSTKNMGTDGNMYVGYRYATYEMLLNGEIYDTIATLTGNTIDSICFYVVMGSEYMDADDTLYIDGYELLIPFVEGYGDLVDTCGADWHWANDSMHAGCTSADSSRWNAAGATGSGTDRSSSKINDNTLIFVEADHSQYDTLRIININFSNIGNDSLKYGVVLVAGRADGDDDQAIYPYSDNDGTSSRWPYGIVYYTSTASISYVGTVYDTLASAFSIEVNPSGQTGTLDSMWVWYDTDNDIAGADSCMIETPTDPDSCTISGLTEATKYYFWMGVYDDNGRDTSAIDSITTESFTHSATVIDTTTDGFSVEYDYGEYYSADSLFLLTDTAIDFSATPDTQRISSSITDPDTLSVSSWPADTKIYFKVGLYDSQYDWSALDSQTTSATGSCPSAADIYNYFKTTKNAVFDDEADSILQILVRIDSVLTLWGQVIDSDSMKAIMEASDLKLAEDGLDNDTSFQQAQNLLNTNLDAQVSSRSTFNEASDQVTVGSNNDKTGYKLAPDGLTAADTAWATAKAWVKACLDSLNLQDNWIATATNLTAVSALCTSIYDSIKLYDGWIAQHSYLVTAIDSIDTAIARINVLLDSIKSQDDWIAHKDTMSARFRALQDWIFRNNLIRNGGFENYAAGWTVVADDASDTGITTSNPNSGLYAMGFSHGLGDSAAYTSQEVYLDSALYRFGYTITGTSGATFYLILEDTSGTDIDTATGVTVGMHTDTASLPAGMYQLTVVTKAEGDPHSGRFDDVWIYMIDDYFVNPSGSGSDTTAIKEMLEGNNYAQKGDTMHAHPDDTLHVNPDDSLNAIGTAWFVDSSRAIGTEVSVSLPDSLWDSLKAIHQDVSTGTGAYPCSLVVLNSADSTSPLQGVYVRFMNDGQTATEAIGTTDGNGMVVASLDAAQYKIWMYKSGITASNPDSVTVSSPAVRDTVYAAVFSPSTPSPELCKVYGNIYDLEGNGDSGIIVTMQIFDNNILHGDTVVISPYAVSDTTDADGAWDISVYPSADLSHSLGVSATIKYMVTARRSTGSQIIRAKSITVPDQSVWRLMW